MALIVKDRVQETSTTAGTGTLTLNGAVLGFQSFAAIGNGNTTYYAVSDPITGDWEAGIGTYTASGTTLSRDTVLSSSNGGSLVTFAASAKNVFCTYPSERAVYLDSAGAYPVQNTFNTLNATTAVLTAGTIATTPSSSTDIVNKTYVDTLVASGIHFHQPVRVESPINLNATYNQPGGAGDGVGATLTNAGTQVALVIDGITMVVNDRVLVYEQTTQTQNGIYVVSDIGSGSTNWVLTRASDADTYVINSAAGLSEGSTVFVQQGATGAGETYTCNTSGVITFGTTNITFAQISSAQIYSAGTGLALSGTTFSIANTGTAGTYGGANSVPVFTTNAQGQVTGVSPTSIAISSAAVSGLAASATTDTTNADNITSGVLGTSRLSGSYTGITGVGALAAGSLASGFTAVSAPLGGTGQTSYAVGDILYADTTTSLAKLADVAVGNALISGGIAAAPSWGKIGLATHVDGTLPVASGGTGATSLTANNVILGNGTSAVNFVAPGTSGNVLTSDGTTWTSSAAGGAFVAGMILLWSGSIASIPSGWALCNGTSGAPDLRDRFVIGAGNTYAVNATGGATTVTLAEANLPSHTHTFSGSGTSGNASGTTTGSISTDFLANFGCISNSPSASGAFGFNTFRGNRPQGSAGTGSHTNLTLNITAHTHSTTISGTTGGTGSGTAFSILPPYYALAYIIKT
jgi:microcystin-dependent protein